MTLATPGDCRDALKDYTSMLATDTETSGLFADDGARISTASIAWIANDAKWKKWAAKYENVTFGVETITEGYDVPIISVAWPFDQGRVDKPESHGQDTLWPEAVNLDRQDFEDLLDLLASNHRLVFHNAKFDLEKYRVGVRRWPGVGRDLEQNLGWDTQNVNALLWPLHPTSLKPTCARIFGQEWEDESAKVKAYLKKAKLPAGRWDLVPWDVIGPYADTDARITLMLALFQEWAIDDGTVGQWLREDGITLQESVLAKVYRRLSVTLILYRMERRGLPYDEAASREAALECLDRAAIAADALPFDPPTDTQARNFFFGNGITSKGIPALDMIPYSTTEKGTPQLTAEITARMVNDRVVHAQDWADYNKVTNAASMWYTGYADATGTDGRLRTCFRQNGTRSTRFSVERVNLQAIPQDYRLSGHKILAGIPTPRNIIANAVPDGWRLYEMDLAQAELRVATMFAKCKRMESMIRNGEDLHTFTTKALFSHVDPTSDEFFQWRQVGKRANFSLQFGSGGATFKAMVSKETGIILSDTEAARIVRDWNRLYPEFGKAIDRHMNIVAKRQAKHGYGWVEFINGERRWFQEYEEAHKAFNQRVQGNLAQFAIDWMISTEDYIQNHTDVQARAEADGIGEAGLVLTVHDSQVLLLPDGEDGMKIATQVARNAESLWAEMFPGIPGGADYHAWEKAA